MVYYTTITNDNNILNVNTSINCKDISANTIIAEEITVSSMSVDNLSSNAANIINLTSSDISSNDITSNEITSNNVNINNDIYYKNFTYIPVGSILTYSGLTEPTGWLICDGREVNKSEYNRLYNVIGNLYGVSSNNEKFILPNLGERVPIGKTNSNNIGNVGGNNSITLTTSQLPSHNHTGTTNTSGSHTHGVYDPGHTHSQWTNQDDFNEWGGNPPSFTDDAGGTSTWNNINSSTTGISLYSNGDHTHTFTTNSTGDGSSVDIRNKFIVLNYIIRY
jgi:microcystin-dependent protein